MNAPPAAAPDAAEPRAAREAWAIMRELVLDNERRREVSEALGLSFARVKALRRIAASPMSMGELAAILGIDAPYMTLVVDDLERQGLVERKPHPRDRRAKLVVATARGARAARRAGTILERPPTELAQLPAPELEALVQALRAARPSPAARDLGTAEGSALPG